MSDATIYDLSFTDNHGQQVDLAQYAGRPVLFVNTASKCGFTPQYEGLQKMYEEFKDQGLVIIGFPCDQFAHQEPGDDAQIEEFCQLNYGVTFPMAEKAHVKGKDASALYKWAEAQLGQDAVPKWNFHKILIGRDGKAVAAFATSVKPDDRALTAAVEAALKK
jgi:glutathione peroxidase